MIPTPVPNWNFQSIKLIAKVYKYLYSYICLCVCDYSLLALIDMSIDFNVISMTGFGHFQLICIRSLVYFGEYAEQIKKSIF